ncbi:hypothetical protein Tco_0147068 [Tanacetum coccineum]
MFLDNKLEKGERMWNSIQNGPYQRPMIPNPDNTQQQILEPLSKMSEGNKKQYIADQKKENLNNVRPLSVSINTKFLNCLQPEWSKYVTMVRHNLFYDVLYGLFVQFKPHFLASRAKKAAKNHDPLALIAHSNASSSHSHAN